MGKDWGTVVKADEAIVECIDPWLDSREIETEVYAQCFQCGCLPFKVLILQNGAGKQRGIQLCGRHYVEVCSTCENRQSCRLAHYYNDKVH